MELSKHEPPSHIFFAGASWGCGFYIGVYKALQEKYGLDGLAKIAWSGNSAGALVALLGASGLDWCIAEKVYFDCMHEAAESGVFQKMSKYHDTALDVVFNENENLYKELNDRIRSIVYWSHNIYR